MDSKKLETYKQRLINLYSELNLEKNTSNEWTQAVQLDQSKIGRLSRMDALQAQAISVETQRRRNLNLEHVKSAIKRIEDEEYGYCLGCGDEINYQRLG